LLTVLIDRGNFAAILVFLGVWGTLVYAPLVHWNFGVGWLHARGALDFAGGTTLQTGVGFSALGILWALRGEPQAALPEPKRPVAWVGMFLIWIGSLALHAAFGYVSSGPERAVSALLCAHLAACAGVLGWTGLEWMRAGGSDGRNACSGAVAGLAAIAGGSGLMAPQSALVVGLLSGLLCCQCNRLLKRDWMSRPVLDVFLLQGVGGALGVILTGIFTTPNVAGLGPNQEPIAGLLAGNTAQVSLQLLAVGATAAWALVVTGLALLLIRLTLGVERQFPERRFRS
jgi:Amt family ammonium transporter